jgi:hypothetical protein
MRGVVLLCVSGACFGADQQPAAPRLSHAQKQRAEVALVKAREAITVRAAIRQTAIDKALGKEFPTSGTPCPLPVGADGMITPTAARHEHGSQQARHITELVDEYAREIRDETGGEDLANGIAAAIDTDWPRTELIVLEDAHEPPKDGVATSKGRALLYDREKGVVACAGVYEARTRSGLTDFAELVRDLQAETLRVAATHLVAFKD